MTLNQITYFEKLAALENMGRAAAALHISQPSLSIALSNLEKELNVTLFNRVGHRLLLSPDGEQFLVHAKKILYEVQQTELHMQSLSANRETKIRIGCLAPTLYEYLPRLMRNFLDLPENKLLKIDFQTDNTSRLLPLLKEGYFDFLICSRSSDPELTQTVLLSQPIVLLCPPGKPVPNSWDEIRKLDLIGFQPRAAAYYEIQSMLQKQNIDLSYIYMAPDEESIAGLVSHGMGYGIVPHVALLKRYQLQIAPLPEPSDDFVRHIYLTQLVNRPATGASKRFLKYLLENQAV